MRLVEEVDDTIAVKENDFDEDTRSADEFKDRILNTNLIINKRNTSFGNSEARPPNTSKMFTLLQSQPIHINV